jgi:hypothetical protein
MSKWLSRDTTNAVFCGLQAGVNYSISGFPDKDVYKTSLSSLDAIKLFPKSLYTVRGISSLGLTSSLTRQNMPSS